MPGHMHPQPSPLQSLLVTLYSPPDPGRLAFPHFHSHVQVPVQSPSGSVSSPGGGSGAGSVGSKLEGWQYHDTLSTASAALTGSVLPLIYSRPRKLGRNGPGPITPASLSMSCTVSCPVARSKRDCAIPPAGH